MKKYFIICLIAMFFNAGFGMLSFISEEKINIISSNYHLIFFIVQITFLLIQILCGIMAYRKRNKK